MEELMHVESDARPPHALADGLPTPSRDSRLLRSLVGTVVGTFVLAGSLLCVIVGLRFAPPRRIAKLFRRALALVMRAYGIRIELVSPAHAPPIRGVLLMSNHVAWLDHLVAFVALGEYMIGLDAVENLRIPVYGRAARAWGQIPIDRADHAAARRSCDAVAAALRQGTPVLVFPEGTRTKSGRLGSFKKGVFHAAMGAGAVVLPVTLDGLYEIAPRGRRRVQPGTVRIRFGEPIDTANRAPDDINGLMAEVHAQLERMLDARAIGGSR
jgi:1-acyl-sn-glycerol-3-phosphate acyltransferase